MSRTQNAARSAAKMLYRANEDNYNYYTGIIVSRLWKLSENSLENCKSIQIFVRSELSYYFKFSGKYLIRSLIGTIMAHPH